MKDEAKHCPNCSAPLDVPMGETELVCPYCASRLRFVPEAGEIEVVRTREEMKYRERVAVQKLILQKQLEQEEARMWRQTAARVAIAALPVVGSVAGRTLFRAALGRRGGCLGCGCVSFVAAALLLAALWSWG
jgi:uncharacterized Zn finger protein (UPF0148 family)